MSSAAFPRLALGPCLAGAALLFASSAGASPAPGYPPIDPGPACAAGAIDDLLSVDGIDLAARGFDLRRLADGFAAESVEVRADQVCDGQGQVVGETLIVSTRWRHDASGARLYVSQQATAESVPAVIEAGWASFSSQGYAFGVTMEASCWGPPGVDLGPKAARRVPLAPRTSHPVPPPCEPSGGELLVPAIAALAPELDPDCFYRRRSGSWSDLAGLGLGDPRTALPAGYAEAFFDLTYLASPAEGCAGPVPAEGAGLSFASSFLEPSGSWAAAAAYGLPPGAEPPAGYLDDVSAWWADTSFQYSVSASRADGGGDRELVRALAAALDPGFADACLTEVRQLTPGEAVALGFRLAEAPAGFFEVWSQRTAQAASGACADAPAGSYSFYWSFSDGADLAIEASLARGAGPGPGGGVRPDGETTGGPDGGSDPDWLAWADAEGTEYSVFGYSVSGGPPPDRELLVAVARSMDPGYGAP